MKIDQTMLYFLQHPRLFVRAPRPSRDVSVYVHMCDASHASKHPSCIFYYFSALDDCTSQQHYTSPNIIIIIFAVYVYGVVRQCDVLLLNHGEKSISTDGNKKYYFDSRKLNNYLFCDFVFLFAGFNNSHIM